VDFVSAVSEAASANESSTATADILASIQEQVNLTAIFIARLLWEPINDSSVSDWENIDSNNAPTWTGISTAQAQAWVDIATNNSPSWGGINTPEDGNWEDIETV
jgi:hypothetical protein